jgi:hypothetical protein
VQGGDSISFDGRSKRLTRFEGWPLIRENTDNLLQLSER